MLAKLKELWERLMSFFKDSEVVAWAWIKTAFGILSAAALVVDPSEFKEAVHAIVVNIGLENWWPVAVAVLGYLLYKARTARDPEMKG